MPVPTIASPLGTDGEQRAARRKRAISDLLDRSRAGTPAPAGNQSATSIPEVKPVRAPILRRRYLS